uniref:SAYSVFN motif domain containing 1 n=1 Tax=Amazona collaria TaxID=241587 RepID=A0A8B9FWQ1_9PSIT
MYSFPPELTGCLHYQLRKGRTEHRLLPAGPHSGVSPLQLPTISGQAFHNPRPGFHPTQPHSRPASQRRFSAPPPSRAVARPLRRRGRPCLPPWSGAWPSSVPPAAAPPRRRAPRSRWERLLLLLKVLLWAVLLGLFVELELGLPYFVLSLLYWMYAGTRGPAERRQEELSAYSVFNPGCVPIRGTLTVEQLERELYYRPAAGR